MPDDAIIPTAIGRSKDGPSFFMSAGARFTVILFRGKLRPVFFNALRTRSLDSLTAESGSPTISKAGSPFDISVSTNTVIPSTPCNALLFIIDTIISPDFIIYYIKL